MNLGIPDRVPLMCQLSIGHMLMNLDVSPIEFWYDPDVFAWGLAALREKYDFDGILVSLHGHDPEWRNHIRAIRQTPSGEEVEWLTGEFTVHPPDELPRHWNSILSKKLRLDAFVPQELPRTLHYIPVSQGLHFQISPEHTLDVFGKVRAIAGESFSLHGEVTSPLDYYLDAVGLDDGLMGFIDHPDIAVRILEHFAELVSGMAVRICDAGVDAIKLSSPFAGSGFLSKRFYSLFVSPFEQKVAKAVRARGVHIYTHTCGSIADRLELILDSGVSGVECLDPPPLGNVELEEAKRRIGRRGFIKGNIDSVNILLPGDHTTILDDARRRLAAGKEGGGFILSTACSVAPSVKPESLLLLREAVERWGWA
jgi:hypothetical protein